MIQFETIGEAETRLRSDALIALGMKFILTKGSFVYDTIVVSQDAIDRSSPSEWHEVISQVRWRIQVLKDCKSDNGYRV